MFAATPGGNGSASNCSNDRCVLGNITALANTLFGLKTFPLPVYEHQRNNTRSGRADIKFLDCDSCKRQKITACLLAGCSPLSYPPALGTSLSQIRCGSVYPGPVCSGSRSRQFAIPPSTHRGPSRPHRDVLGRSS